MLSRYSWRAFLVVAGLLGAIAACADRVPRPIPVERPMTVLNRDQTAEAAEAAAAEAAAGTESGPQQRRCRSSPALSASRTGGVVFTLIPRPVALMGFDPIGRSQARVR